MELCGSVVKTLKAIAGDESAVNAKDLSAVVSWTVAELEGGEVELSAIEADDLVARSVHSALCILYLEAAKQNNDIGYIQDFLEVQCGWTNPERVSIVASTLFTSALPKIRERLSSMAISNPSVVGMSWRVDHILGDRELETPTKSRQRFEVKMPLSDGEEFSLSCTAEQMQVLAEKLRDMLTESQRAHN
eukprot:TRINITY_DN13794_c0_g2_i1.p1 TRINITY_DN13794_c0_g2~~TRINITY_DN13794_c0_g2_i1.p1  ORF type:complete len:190 (+),score=22.96 TRINITY_DN13794_c0_g2_i1:98-667(+)